MDEYFSLLCWVPGDQPTPSKKHAYLFRKGYRPTVLRDNGDGSTTIHTDLGPLVVDDNMTAVASIFEQFEA